jgi:hypothetical protein
MGFEPTTPTLPMSALTRSKSLGAPKRGHAVHFMSVCAAAMQTGHFQIRVVFAEYLRGRIMRFGLHKQRASDLIFCV